MKRFLVLLIFSVFGLAAVRAQDSVVLQEEDENKIFDVVEQMPEYPEGMAALLKFISNNLKVPKGLESEDLIPSKVAASFIVEKDGSLMLTKEGHEIAENTLEKHEFLTAFFIKIGVDPISAEDQACKIEHGIDEDTFQKLKKFICK